MKISDRFIVLCVKKMGNTCFFEIVDYFKDYHVMRITC